MSESIKLKAGVLVLSDRISAGKQIDLSGKEAVAALAPIAEVAEMKIIPDEADQIRETLLRWCDVDRLDLIFTLGGTGLGPRDVTPEATRSVLDRELPALITALLINGLKSTHKAMLSRAVAGARASTLIINLPGNPNAVRESIDYLLPTLPHAIKMIHGGDHETRRG